MVTDFCVICIFCVGSAEMLREDEECSGIPYAMDQKSTLLQFVLKDIVILHYELDHWE